jgi:hypothetical protein
MLQQLGCVAGTARCHDIGNQPARYGKLKSFPKFSVQEKEKKLLMGFV